MQMVERIVPANLDDDELWRRNGEYVSADAYDAALRRIEELQAALDHIKNGAVVMIPVSVDHAKMMHLLAERYLKDNGATGA